MTAALRGILEKLLKREDLAEDEAGRVLQELTDPALSPVLAGAVLVALRAKGETPVEVRGFARAMRQLARRPVLAPGSPIVDVVGTGGDASGSVNISTGAALLTAACGLRVVKHGNRSISSKSGSADTLEALGLRMPLDEVRAGACLAATGFTFLFAPHYHPATKAIAPVRAALGVRTMFNILGPLTNPAAPPFSLVGAFSLPAAELIANAFAGLAVERVMVVHGEPGWDEATPVGPFHVFDVQDGRVTRSVRTAASYGMAACKPQDLAGGDAQYNAARLRDVLEGRDRGAHRDAIVLETALVLELTGRESEPRLAARAAAQAIDDGRAEKLLAGLARFGGGA
ncbi:MAG TPA: anthranilate phosphoribosyltransferase [Steroidobacteraceae bacterium]|nr:anthranilate phosphoribosyltransferase [Steroidobacteraceae bacterium]